MDNKLKIIHYLARYYYQDFTLHELSKSLRIPYATFHRTVQEMQDQFACQCHNFKVALGPCIRSCCYEAGEEFKDYFPEDFTIRNNKVYVDIAGANIRQLVAAGIPKANIFDCGICTCCNQDCFSFRRDGEKAGRMVSLIMLK